MIDSKIIKLTQLQRPYKDPCIDDVRIGLEMLKRQHYPNIPAELKLYLWNNVRHDIIKEYFDDNLDQECPDIVDNWIIKWKDNE